MGTDRNKRELINLLHVPMPMIPPGLDPQLASYLQELTRTIEENLRRVFGGEAGTGTPYHAEVIGTNHAPFYDCIVREIQAGTDADLTVADNAPVLDLIDLHHFEETMNVGGKLLCWELGTNSYVGIQYFGRSTIGLP